MKKIMVFMLFLIVSISSFSTIYSWRKIYEKDEFGDRKQQYSYRYVTKDKKVKFIIYRNQKTKEKRCQILMFEKKLITGREYVIKMKYKPKNYNNEDIKEIKVSANKRKKLIIYEEQFVEDMIYAFLTNKEVKFNIAGTPVVVEGKEFAELYDAFVNEEQ